MDLQLRRGAPVLNFMNTPEIRDQFDLLGFYRIGAVAKRDKPEYLKLFWGHCGYVAAYTPAHVDMYQSIAMENLQESLLITNDVAWFVYLQEHVTGSAAFTDDWYADCKLAHTLGVARVKAINTD